MRAGGGPRACYVTAHRFQRLKQKLLRICQEELERRRPASHVPLSVILAAVVGAIVALAARAFGSPPIGMVLGATAAFALGVTVFVLWNRSSVNRVAPILEPRFPSPRG